MKKIIIILSIFFLVIVTTITKNSTKSIEKQIYNTKENLIILKQKHELILLEFNYLSSPEKLMEYQSKYFENELTEIDIKKLKKLKVFGKELQIDQYLDTSR